MNTGPVTTAVDVFVIVTVAQAPALACVSTYSTEKVKFVVVVSAPVVGETVPKQRIVDWPVGGQVGLAATAGRAGALTVNPTARTNAASVARVARCTIR
jgi:hypothetical protein